MELKINFWAVITAVVVNFIFGSIWYMPLFGKIWGKEKGYDPDMKPDSKVMAKGMLLVLIGNILFACVLAYNLAAWQFVPGVKECNPAMNAVHSAIFLWMGFYLPIHLSAIAWEKKSLKLFAIDGGYHLLSLLVVALVLTLWK
jgi:hypothetical protein